MSNAEHFDTQAASYARYRPTYPAALFAWLATQAPGRELAWDAGCGSGQAAAALAEHFTRVLASDPSANQLAAATPHEAVTYLAGAEAVPALPDGGVDLVTVAQAYHWFDHAAFHAEARRVLRPGGVLAVWTYNLARIAPAVDRVVAALYADMDGWWPPERRLVEDGYAGLALPGAALAPPACAMTAEWTLDHLLGYLQSWSAVARCRRETGRDAVADHARDLAAAWGEPGRSRRVTWPLTVLAARL